MKQKIFSVLFALVLICSMGLVMAVPVSAIDAGVTTVVVAPSTINTAGQYTITIDTTLDLAITDDGDIRITFPEGTDVPAGYVASSISINDKDVVEGGGVDVVIEQAARKFTIDVPADVSASTDVVVIFKTTALIVNPDIIAADYTLIVSTSEEVDSVASAQYAITAPDGPVDRYSGVDPLALVYEDSHATITLAIAAAATGDTLKVHADTYEERVVIDVAGLTLESYDGKATTIIDATGEVSGISIQAASVIVDGFTVESPVDGIGIYLGPEGDDVIIQNNTINRAGWSIQADGSSIENVHVLDNLFSSLWTGIGAVDWLIEDNVIRGDIGGITTPTAIVMPGGADAVHTKDNIIRGNIISDDISCGIFLRNEGGGTFFDDILIEGNTISGADPYGIETSEGLNITGLVIIKNDITGSWEDGIRIRSWATGAGNVINYNNLYGNGLMSSSEGHEWWGGIKNKTNKDVDARYNFWSDPSATPLDIGGPGANTHTTYAPAAGTALGNGDRVSKDVIYNPWLTVPYERVVDEGIRYYGSDTLTLQKGWNTLSVPLKLYDPANSITKIEGMGDFLTAENYDDYILEYEPGEGWLTPETLVPCRGYYIKMKAASRFPVLYYNDLGLPALTLDAGWNLIGSAFGIDSTAMESLTGTLTVYEDSYVLLGSGTLFTSELAVGEELLIVAHGKWVVIEAILSDTKAVMTERYSLNGVSSAGSKLSPGAGSWGVASSTDTEATMKVGTALNSIGAQASVVVSPSVPGQLVIWSLVYTSGERTFMHTGEAYWVFMTGSGTLAGFEITPFYFTP